MPFFFESLSLLLAVAGVYPLLRPNHGKRINLSVWVVIVANSWVAAAGGLWGGSQGFAVFYLVAGAGFMTPVLLFNLRSGAWGGLPLWHRISAGILPLGIMSGFYFGGEVQTWTAVAVSAMLAIQLFEGYFRGVCREHLLTWGLFFGADGLAAIISWTGASVAAKCLFIVWVAQSGVVILMEMLRRGALKRRSSPEQVAPTP